jgi:hypothetical protein
VFASRRQTNRSLRLPGSVNQVELAPFCTSSESFPPTHFWRRGIENCQSITTNFCEQYQRISWNILGLMASISDQ